MADHLSPLTLISPIDIPRCNWDSGKQGSQSPASEQINRMIAREKSYTYNPKDVRNPITHRHTYQARGPVRHLLYRSGPRDERLKRGSWTAGELEEDEGDLVAYTKKKLESKFPLLARAVNSWTAASFVDDTLRVDLPRGLTTRSKYYEGSGSNPSDVSAPIRVPFGTRNRRENTDDGGHNSASRKKTCIAQRAPPHAETRPSPAQKGRSNSRINRAWKAIDTRRGSMDLRSKAEPRSLLHPQLHPRSQGAVMSGKATKGRRMLSKPLNVDSDAGTAKSEERDTRYERVDSGDDGESEMCEFAVEGESEMEHVRDEDEYVEEDGDREFEESRCSRAMEHDVDGEGHSIGEKSDGDGHGGPGEEDAEDEDDDEDEVSLLPRRSDGACNRVGKEKRSRYSQSDRHTTAKRQRHLH